MEWIAGRAVVDREPLQLSLGLEDGLVAKRLDGPPPAAPVAEGLLLPAPVNGHTHVGDGFAREADVPTDLEAAVAPPDGLKHRLLAEADREDLVEGMRRALQEMLRGGCHRFLDFRENGLEGVEALREAASGLPVDPTILARPEEPGYDADEVAALLEAADGLGLSGIGDVPVEDARALAEAAREADAAFALHASEGEREDVDLVLDLDPDFVVHMVHATDEDLADVAAADVPVVVCPRSNHHFASIPPVEAMAEAGVDVALGTDNAMLHPAQVLDEAAFLRERRPELAAETVYEWTFESGRRLTDEDPPDPFAVGSPADVVVAEDRGGSPFEVATRAPRIAYTPWGDPGPGGRGAEPADPGG